MNGPVRVSRLSYVMALFLLVFDFCMFLYHEIFTLNIPKAVKPLGLLSMILLVNCFTYDLILFAIIRSEYDR